MVEPTLPVPCVQGAATWDPTAAVKQSHGVFIAPRTDIPNAEGSFAVLHEGKTLRGFVQVFKDGSAGYWKDYGQQATVAPNLKAALDKLFTIEIGGTASGKATVKGTLTVIGPDGKEK